MEEKIKKVEEIKTSSVEATKKEEVKVAPQQEQPKKKGHGCLITFIIFLLLLIGVTLFVYFRIKQFLSNVGKEEDLGITYTQQDYDNLQEKFGIEDVPEENVCISCSAPVYSQSKELEIVITSQEASAAFDIVNQKMPVGSIQNTQIRFSEGMAEISTLLTYEGKTLPLYVSGTLSKDTSTSITGTVSSVKIGKLKLPNNVNTMVRDGLLSIFNESLSSLGNNLRIDSLGITSEGLKFEGMAPNKIN